MKHDIVLAPFPFDDLSGAKTRPAVCLTNPVGFYNHVVVAYITSQTPPSPEFSDLVLRSTDPDFSATGLRTTSSIRLHRLISIPSNRIRWQLGTLPAGCHADLEQKLRVLFGL